VDQYIVEGITTNQLRKGPGHYPQTALPGDPGNAAIAGHRTTYGAPFYRLNELQPGDPILVTTSTGQFRYTVSDSKVVKPTDVSVLDPTPDDRLTLTTCNPRFSASTRLIVVGRLDNPPAPTAVSAGPTLPPTPRNLGSGDRSAWPHVILYGAITLLLWVAVRLAGARSRGGRRWAVWVLGIPLCLVPLWFVFENVVRLLPSNI
jgi:sortase A